MIIPEQFQVKPFRQETYLIDGELREWKGEFTNSLGNYLKRAYKRIKKETLNYLLKICYPSEEDNLKTFKEKIKNIDISKERLVEVSIYAPQWKKFIDDFLMS